MIYFTEDDEWLAEDVRFFTSKTFLTDEEYVDLKLLHNGEQILDYIRNTIKKSHRELLQWTSNLPLYYPPTLGKFYKDIIAGHVDATKVAKNHRLQGVYYDGYSHFLSMGTLIKIVDFYAWRMMKKQSVIMTLGMRKHINF